MSIAKGFLDACKRTVEEYNCNSLQIFCKSPRGRREKPLSEEEAKEVNDYVKKHNLYLNSHCSYLLNFAKPMTIDPWPLESLISDMVKTHALGGYGVVLHIGKYLELEKNEAYKYLSDNLTKVLEMTEDTDIPILMETTAGQGTEIGFRFDELAEVYDLITQKDRVKFCLDTAHVFAAGYDIRTKETVKETFDEFDRLLGLENLKLVHLNDSKKAFGSRVDRHANFGAEDAMIGNEGVTAVAKIAIERDIPIVIETPEKDGRTHKGDLQILRQLIK